MEIPTDLTPAQLAAGIRYLEASIAYARQKRELRLAQELGLTIMATGEVGPDLARFPRADA